MYLIKSDAFTEKGKVKNKVRIAINDGLVPQIKLANETVVDMVMQPNGAYYGIVAKDLDGKPIYARLEIAITEQIVAEKVPQEQDVEMV